MWRPRIVSMQGTHFPINVLLGGRISFKGTPIAEVLDVVKWHADYSISSEISPETSDMA